jgi:hydroxymethylglutaryl-CoA lyase
MVHIRDCAPRDGLQSEQPVPASRRAELANRLFAAGLRDVEVASFVSPRAVPAMADAAEVVAAVSPPDGARAWVLVPNVKGAELALAAGVRHITVTVSASEAYSQKNVGMAVRESIAQAAAIRGCASDVVLDAVVSCAFGSPFDDVAGPADVLEVVEQLRAIGVDEVTLADTTGAATPHRVRAVLDRTGADVGLHLHDTRGTALANALAGVELGVTRFDTSLGGLGGSPFAPGAGGNLPTEQLVLVLRDSGALDTLELGALLETAAFLTDLVGHELPSRVAAAGALPAFRSGDGGLAG